MKQKKLSLKKVTISVLDNEAMSQAFAGAGVSQQTRCPEDDNCYSSPWICYTKPGYPTCVTCGGGGGGTTTKKTIPPQP